MTKLPTAHDNPQFKYNQMRLILDEGEIISQGFAVIKYSPTTCATCGNNMKKGDTRLWTSHYQASPNACYDAWNAMQHKNYLHSEVQPKHMFWALYHLKNYSTEIITARAMFTTPTTLRKWIRFVIDGLKNLSFDLIKFQNRLRPNVTEAVERRRLAKISVDGVDFLKKEDFPFDPKYSSHKFGGSPAFRYEIGLSLVSDHIVWVNGPFKAGKPDLNIFREGGLKETLIMFGELAVGDGGYGDVRVRQRHEGFHKERLRNALSRARHESMNQRIKNFGCMAQRWRHDKHDHFATFHAVVGLVQLELKYKPLMKIRQSVL